MVSLGKRVIFEGENELCKETALCSLYVRNRKEEKLLLKMSMRPLRVNQRIMPGSKADLSSTQANLDKLVRK